MQMVSKKVSIDYTLLVFWYIYSVRGRSQTTTYMKEWVAESSPYLWEFCGFKTTSFNFDLGNKMQLSVDPSTKEERCILLVASRSRRLLFLLSFSFFFLSSSGDVFFNFKYFMIFDLEVCYMCIYLVQSLQLDSVWLSLTQLDSAWLSLTQLDSAWLSLTQVDSAWLRLTQLDSAWLSLTQLDSARVSLTQFDSAWFSSIQLNSLDSGQFSLN